jgi:peroxiredoxin
MLNSRQETMGKKAEALARDENVAREAGKRQPRRHQHASPLAKIKAMGILSTHSAFQRREPSMKKLSAALAILLLLTTAALAASPKVGDTLPDITVKTQLQPAEAEYLGLPAQTTGFQFSQLKADALIVELYSMYCPYCQAEAKAVNHVFARLAASPSGARVKFMAVAVGNTPFEVELFRKKYQTRMPMLPDADNTLHKAFMDVVTPSFFVLKPGPGGFAVTFYHKGVFHDEDAFYDQLLRAAAPL